MIDEENLSVFGSAPPPNKDDVLFRPDTDSETNACIGNTMGDWLYWTGFRRAAEHLAQHICDTGSEQDFLVYPMVYLYRHHIELVLKSIVECASGLLDRPLTDDDHKILGRHGLLELWQAARPLLNPVCARANNSPFPEGELEGIDSYIRQIHEHDPNGQNFRYATVKAGGKGRPRTKKPSLRPGLKLVNVRVFAISMVKLLSYLEGIESWFGDLEDAYAAIKRGSNTF